MNAMVEDDVRRAYEEGGPERLAAHLRKLDAYLPGEHLLTDAGGRDLVTGADRSDLLMARSPLATGRPGCPTAGSSSSRPTAAERRPLSIHLGRPPVVRPAEHPALLRGDRAGHRRDGLRSWPSHLAAPLRRLRRVVDRFGRGDLSARVGSTRKDEIGELVAGLRRDGRPDRDPAGGRAPAPPGRLARAALAPGPARRRRRPGQHGDDPRASLGRIKRDVGRLTVLVNELLQLPGPRATPRPSTSRRSALDDLLRGAGRRLRPGGRGQGLPARPPGRGALPGPGRARSCSAGPSRTSSATRSATRREGTAVEVGLGVGTATWRRSTSATAARASPRSRSGRSSSRSSGSRGTGAGPAAASAWAWPSPAAPSTFTEAGSPPATPARGSSSRSSCRSPARPTGSSDGTNDIP